jgi:hypothetical protein
MAYASREYQHVAEEMAFYSPTQHDGGAMAGWPVAHLLRGTWTSGSSSIATGERLGHAMTHSLTTLTLELFADPDCDSVMNRELFGPLVAELMVITTEDSWPPANVHFGTFAWGGGTAITGTVTGIGTPASVGTDVGMSRSTGRLAGRFQHGELGGGVVLASYQLDVDAVTPDVTDVSGRLDGVVLVEDDPSVKPPGRRRSPR